MTSKEIIKGPSDCDKILIFNVFLKSTLHKIWVCWTFWKWHSCVYVLLLKIKIFSQFVLLLQATGPLSMLQTSRNMLISHMEQLNYVCRQSNLHVQNKPLRSFIVLTQLIGATEWWRKESKNVPLIVEEHASSIP